MLTFLPLFRGEESSFSRAGNVEGKERQRERKKNKKKKEEKEEEKRGWMPARLEGFLL